MSTPHAAIVLLGAGASQRYGAAKLVLPIDGVAMLRRAALAARAACARVIVVTGAQRELTEPLLAQLDVQIAFNPDWAQGMGRSIAHGVQRALERDAALDAVLIALADQYRVGAVEYAALLRAHEANPDAIVAAGYADTFGAPCVFPRAFFARLRGLRGPGARALLQANRERVHVVPLELAAYDIDTPLDFATAQRNA